jgi:cysteine-rich repeat protein
MSSPAPGLALAVALCSLIAAAAYADVVSTFDSDLEGWTTDNTGLLTRQGSGGNPGGFLQLDNDETSVAHLFAPPRFLGNRSVFDGGSLSFDGSLVGAGGSLLNAPDDYGVVHLTGGGITASAALRPRGVPVVAEFDVAPEGATPPEGSWATYSAPLIAGAWGLSPSEWTALLSNLTEIRITIEALSGPEVEGFDNFILAPSPLCGNGQLDGAEQCDDGNTAAGDGCSANCQVESSFLCYKAKTRKGSPFEKRDVTLADAFETRETVVSAPKTLCNPADRDGAGIAEPETHMVSYPIKSTEKHEKVRGFSVSNPLGPLVLDTLKEDRLLVPSTKGVEGAPAPPASFPIDHFKCYKAKISKRAAKFPKNVEVTLSDQFDLSGPRRFAVKGPKHLCLPVNKNGEGIQDPGSLLVCYAARPAKGQPKHAKRSVFVGNQFGTLQLDTVKEEELCVLSAPGQPGFN